MNVPVEVEVEVLRVLSVDKVESLASKLRAIWPRNCRCSGRLALEPHDDALAGPDARCPGKFFNTAFSFTALLMW